ncbi:5-hydroxytryptamine receptor 6 [Rhincodon typus]|uniref:5-hydroxytryptamine receptor 6 n=1 Tax=Rhincodon typus TaxID=259920 RepID=UPI00202ED6C6|nr:5-hydroxytryptamine receptor 6 [Rhincodon typus]
MNPSSGREREERRERPILLIAAHILGVLYFFLHVFVCVCTNHHFSPVSRFRSPQLPLESGRAVQLHVPSLAGGRVACCLALLPDGQDSCPGSYCCACQRLRSPLRMDNGLWAEGKGPELGQGAAPEGRQWIAAFLCLIIILTTAGNSLLILLIFTQRSLRNTSNYFLVSLFMSDLMVGLVVMPPAMLNELYGRWVLESELCSIWYSFDVMCCSASILNLCVISLDRYFLIISPLKYKLRMTSCRALFLIFTTWTLAALASFLPIEMGWHEMDFDAQALNSTLELPEEAAQCRLLVSLPYALIASSLTFFLPSVAISFTYCRILLAAKKQAVQVASLTTNVATTSDEPVQLRRAQNPSARTSDSRKFTKHSKKALKASLTLGVLLGMFFVAWLPFFVANVTQAVCECVPALLFDVLTWLGYCNSTMNPIIYPLFMRDFKRAMAKYLPCCHRWWERRPTVVSLSMKNSNSGRRLGLSLPNMLTLPPQTGSGDSVIQVNEHILLAASKDQQLTKDQQLEDSLQLFELEQTDQEFQGNPLNTPMD